ncbi:unnamed protein product [Pleuronectes platessa]|uniref:Uncharacterized protein n=1 Tax=Pleuronectes platessa TaxID=8262 RepID=A0A9N7ZF82_PLEPL|nr:unnamed protein product [Pleuronectes platessa]
MAKWFRDFPINLKNGSERVRSASESGSQPRTKPSFSRDSLKVNQRKDGGVGGLLAGRNRKNSATELGRNNAGSGRKNSKIEATGTPDENRQVRTSSLAQAYISRMIKVDKQYKTPKLNGISEKKQPDNETRSDIKTTLIILEDYADPFDAEKTREQREAERAGVNDGYMEPYDAQVIITGERSARLAAKSLFESVCPAGPRPTREEGRRGEALASKHLRHARMRADWRARARGCGSCHTTRSPDVRPPGSNELPWEWRKEDIVTERCQLNSRQWSVCRLKREQLLPPARQQQQQQQQQQQPTADAATATP